MKLYTFYKIISVIELFFSILYLGITQTTIIEMWFLTSLINIFFILMIEAYIHLANLSEQKTNNYDY